jgi:hypothetical protein
MENDGKKRVGRLKTRPQSGPLVLEGSLTRTKLEIELASETADELREYARWVELSSSLATGDATSATVDYALRETFKRDRLWQERRRRGIERASTPAQVPAPVGKATPAPASPPAPLPPPTNGARPVPSPDGPAVSR